MYYENDIPRLTSDDSYVELPEVDKYLPTDEGEPPLARAKKEDWNVFHGDRMEHNTMPGGQVLRGIFKVYGSTKR